MNLTPYQVYLLNKEYQENIKKVEKEKRNFEIRTILAASNVVREYQDQQVSVGTTFSVAFMEDGEFLEEEIYTLVENKVSSESIKDGIVSLSSDFGVAIHRKKEGESFAYETETGLLMSGIISKIYSKEEHDEFIKGRKESGKKLCL